MIHYIAALALATLLNCSSGPSIAGGDGSGTRTGNPVIAGIIVDNTGKRAAGAIVRVRAADYLAPVHGATSGQFMRNVRTDDTGFFRVDSLPAGAYAVEANDGTSGAALMNCTLSIIDTFRDLGTAALRPYASVNGTVALPPDSGPVFVQIYGLDRIVRADSATGGFSFGDLPPGAYDLRFLPATPDYGRQVTSTGVIAPGQTVSLLPVLLHSSGSEDYLGWTSFRKIPISKPSADLTAFPILVRLSSTSFGFSVARDRGIDVRFSSSTGTKLPFEIESWDSAAGQAAIWVLVDTIRATVDSQFVTMYWGNPSAPDFSNSAAVFDTARGFCGVWHLSGNAPGIDATASGNALTDYGSQPQSGIIDGARQFAAAHGDSMCAVSPSGLEPQSLTVSVWFKRQGNQLHFAKLVDKGARLPPYQSYTLEMRAASNVAGFQTARADSSFVLLETGPVIADNTWYFLCGTFNAQTGEQILYLNGVPVDTAINMTPLLYDIGFGRALYLGAQQTDATSACFNGLVDEVRVERVVRSAGWIRAGFENQKQ